MLFESGRTPDGIIRDPPNSVGCTAACGMSALDTHTKVYLARGATVQIPLELAAPAVLAGLMVSLARNPGFFSLWEDIFAGRGLHHPTQGSDLAGVLTRSIQISNRRPEGLRGQARLFCRIIMLIGSLQFEEARKRRENYWLALVEENPEGEDAIYFIRDPYRWLKPEKQQRLIVQTTYTVKARDWQKVATKGVEALVQDLSEKG